MFKKINHWHLSILVLIASVFSLMLVQKVVFAQWEDPIGLPGESGDWHFVINPLAEDLEMNNFKFFDTDLTIDPAATDKILVNDGNIRVINGEICLNGDCQATWPSGGGSGGYWEDSYDSSGININGIQYFDGGLGVGIGGRAHSSHKLSLGGSGSAVLKMNPGEVWAYQSDLKLRSTSDVYTDEKFGIGTSQPNPSASGEVLHVYDDTNNAEIDIQSGGGAGDHWGIYHDAGSDELRFWKDGNNVVRIGANQGFSVSSNSVASGPNAIAMGNNSHATGNYSVAIGNTSRASGQSSFATGYLAEAFSDSAIAMGHSAQAQGPDSVAIGLESTTGVGKYYALALGKGSDALETASVAIGLDATASGIAAMAMGRETTASGGHSVAMGYQTNAAGNYSFAIGEGVTADGSHSVAMGESLNAAGDNAVAIGSNLLALGSNSVAMGSYGLSTGSHSFVFGGGDTALETTASGNYSVAMGYKTQATNNYALAMGQSSVASGEHSVAMGRIAKAIGPVSFASGYDTEASGGASFAHGWIAKAGGTYSTSIGIRTNAEGEGSIALGANAKANHDSSFVVGLSSFGAADCVSDAEDQFKVCGDTALEGELCLNGDCTTELFGSPSPDTYTVAAYAGGFSTATASCYTGYALTEWSCDPGGGTLGSCSQNASDAEVVCQGSGCTAIGTCTRFDASAPPDGPATYAVNCSAVGFTTCTVGCPVGSYALTDWSCAGNISSCSQNADTGEATCNGINCSGSGICTEI